MLYLASRPAVEIYESHVKIGQAAIPWRHIRRLDRSANIPLMVRLTLSDKTRILVVYPGDPQSSSGLLRSLRRHAREALIDGVPYRQFWGEAVTRRRRRKSSARAALSAAAPRRRSRSGAHVPAAEVGGPSGSEDFL